MRLYKVAINKLLFIIHGVVSSALVLQKKKDDYELRATRDERVIIKLIRPRQLFQQSST
jgi:hypothetical protein